MKKHTTGFLLTIGIVYGDIGTSVLYVMQAALLANQGPITSDYIYGIISLIFWTLTLVSTLKYVVLVLRADNHGEGGIFALYANIRKNHKKYLIFAIIGGASLIADSIITPAITITSAIEGLKVLNISSLPIEQHQIIIIVIIIMGILFTLQRLGTDKVGRLFGPIMLVWFLFIGITGLLNIQNDFHILASINPYYGIKLILSSPPVAVIAIISCVFLATTGAEALYSDLGHVGRENIYISWPFIKLMLLINYMGQGAYIIAHPQIDINPFFAIVPQGFMVFSVIIATFAAIIASQALITGTYTLVMEAINLSLLPQIKVRFPSKHFSQVYIGFVTIFMFIASSMIVILFQESAKMQNAYGLSITITMMMTTILLHAYLRDQNWNRWLVNALIGFIFAIDFTFFIASAVKFMHGGVLIVIIALFFITIMYTWHTAKEIYQNHITSRKLSKYIPAISMLCTDNYFEYDAKYLVYPTKQYITDEIDVHILKSIFSPKPKRAERFVFINLKVVDSPHHLSFKHQEFADGKIISIQFSHGFKDPADLDLYLKLVIHQLNYPNTNKLIKQKQCEFGNDIKYIILDEQFNWTDNLTTRENIIFGIKYRIKKHTAKPQYWFGLSRRNFVRENVKIDISH